MPCCWESRRRHACRRSSCDSMTGRSWRDRLHRHARPGPNAPRASRGRRSARQIPRRLPACRAGAGHRGPGAREGHARRPCLGGGVRTLLDECVPRPFRRELPDLPVSHARDEHWTGRCNGVLPRLMRKAGVAIPIAVDRNLACRQNVAAAGIAAIVLHARGEGTSDLVPLVPALCAALADATPSQVKSSQACRCLTPVATDGAAKEDGTTLRAVPSW